MASPQPNPDQLSYLDAEMKMTNTHSGEVGRLSGEGAAGTRAEVKPRTRLHLSAAEGPALDQPLPMKKSLLSPVISTGSEPPYGESDSLPLISRKGQELISLRASVAKADFFSSFLGNFGPFPGPVRVRLAGPLPFAPHAQQSAWSNKRKVQSWGQGVVHCAPSLTGQSQHFLGTLSC